MPKKKKKRVKKNKRVANRKVPKGPPPKVEIEPSKLFSNKLFLITFFVPIITTTIVSSEMNAESIVKFTFLFVILAAAHHISGAIHTLRQLRGTENVHHSLLDLKSSLDKGEVHAGHLKSINKVKAVFFSLLMIVFLVFGISTVPNTNVVLLTLLCTLLTITIPLLRTDKPGQIILQAIAILTLMSAFAVLALAYQIEEIRLPVFIIGFGPASILAAAAVAMNTETFLNSGWTRMKEYVRRSGETQLRPGGLTNLFVIFLFFGPCLTFFLATGGYVPSGFLLSGVILYLSTKLAHGFQNEQYEDNSMGRQAIVYAAAMSGVALIAGILAKFI